MREFDFEKTPIVDIANEILLDGVKRNASDIHFDPYKDGLTIRMRVDGVLYDYSSVPAAYKRNMISRIKMIASMNIMETRLPQDGAIKSKIGDKTLDLRVSSLPTHNGEKVVLRILDYSKSLQGLETLGFSEHNLKKIIKMIEIPNGIVLVTGATGSGKSTTVYSILQKLNTREVNIITVEDPVEMEVEGLNQVQAQQEIGLDFATVLRSILRQDPDIIMIGEIRDGETARIAVRASITGHKVLSTIHTNNALNTIERLTDMDVERYLIGTSLNGIISQKLARKLCPHCRIARETNDYEKSLFKTVLHKTVDKVYDVNPEGCEHCYKGYHDRIAIAEVLVITDEIRNAITIAEPKEVMRKLVYYDGHTHTLLEDSLEKVELGETSIEEILKLVDLENDLAVARAFYDEIEEALRKNPNATKDTIETGIAKSKDEKELEEEVKKYKQQKNNIIEIAEEQDVANTTAIGGETLTENNVSDLEASQSITINSNHEENQPVETQPELVSSQEPVQEQPAETQPELVLNQEPVQEQVVETQPELVLNQNITEQPVQEPIENEPVYIETFDNETIPQDNIEVLDNTSLETIPENNIEVFGEEQNPIEQFDNNEVLNEKKDDSLEALDNIINSLDDNNTNESLNTEPTLSNPLKDNNLGIETLDNLNKPEGPINYDQMVKIPFVDETVDL